jgi:hypothetical protein
LTSVLDKQTVTAGPLSIRATMPDSPRQALMSGAWDATALLLADYDDVRRVAQKLPYIAGF